MATKSPKFSKYDSIKKAIATKDPTLLVGPPGVGKTTFLLKHFEQQGKPCVTIPCSRTTEPADLLGSFRLQSTPTGPTTVWMDGPLSLALKQGLPIYFDEIDLLSDDVLSLLHSLCDDRRAVSGYIDGTWQTLTAQGSTQVVASTNHISKVSHALLDRFVVFSFPVPGIEHPKLKAILEKLQSTGILASDQFLSKRKEQQFVKLFEQSGIPFEEALRATFLSRLTEMDQEKTLSLINNLM